MSRVFDCIVLTPERSIYEGQAEFTVVQAHDGEMGFLPGHMRLIGELGVGEMRIMNKDQIDRMVIEGGIVEVSNNKVTVLAENAFLKQDLNAVELQEKLKKLLEIDDGTYNKTLKFMETQKLKALIKVAMK